MELAHNCYFKWFGLKKAFGSACCILSGLVFKLVFNSRQEISLKKPPKYSFFSLSQQKSSNAKSDRRLTFAGGRQQMFRERVKEQGMHRVVLSLFMFLQLLPICGSGASWTKARGCNQTTTFSSPWWSFPPLTYLINFLIHLYSGHPKPPIATGFTIHLSIEWQSYFLWVFQKIFFVI